MSVRGNAIQETVLRGNLFGELSTGETSVAAMSVWDFSRYSHSKANLLRMSSQKSESVI